MADERGSDLCKEESARAIIEELANNKKVEELVRNIVKGDKAPEIQDLIQYIYEQLLIYDPEKIINLHNKNQLIFFIVRMITNNYNSTNSRFYYTDRKNKWIEINDISPADVPTDTDNE